MIITLPSISERNESPGCTVPINQDRKWSKEGRKVKRERGRRGVERKRERGCCRKGDGDGEGRKGRAICFSHGDPTLPCPVDIPP